MHIYRYQLPYRHKLHLKQGVFSYREGLLLEKDGQWAEVAPFPGLSQESLEDCLDALLMGVFDAWPALAWAMHVLSHPLDNRPQTHELVVNALLPGGTSKAVFKQAQDLYQEGYRCFKLKIGLRDQQEDLFLIHELLDAFPELSLRLDANRSWSLKTALFWLAHLPECGIEYLEEPLENPADYHDLWAYQECPIGFDESLCELRWDGLIPKAKALILKPTVLGPERLFYCLSLAQKHQIPVVFSSVFESGLSLRYLSLLAQQVQSLGHNNLALGLDTWRFFSDDLCDPAFVVQGGKLDFLAPIFTRTPQVKLKWVRQLL